MNHRDDGRVLNEEVVQLDEELLPLLGVELVRGLLKERVVLRVAVPRPVGEPPVVFHLRRLSAGPRFHIGGRVGTLVAERELLEVSVELTPRIRALLGRTEENTGIDALILDVETDRFERALDDLLRTLTHRTDRSQEDDAQLLSILVADTVAVRVDPSGFIE